MLCSSLAFSAAFGGMVVSLIKVHRFYRGAGFSIDKARKEFSDGVMSNKDVQQVIIGQSRKWPFKTFCFQAANQAAAAASRAAAAHVVNEATRGRY